MVGCVVYSRLTKIEELVVNHNELEVFVQYCFTFCFNFYLFVGMDNIKVQNVPFLFFFLTILDLNILLLPLEFTSFSWIIEEAANLIC